MWRSRTLLFTETFSYTAPGDFWSNHEWLSELLFYGLYRAGGLPLLVGAAALTVTLAWWITWSLMEGPVKRRVLLSAVAMPAYAAAWTVRPQVFTLLLLAIVAWCMRRRRFWCLPLIFLIWANLHGAFVLGLIVLAVASIAIVSKDRSGLIPLSLTLLLSALATLINPLGITLWTAIPKAIAKGVSIGIREWRPARLLAPEDLPFWILATVLIGLVIRQGKRSRTDTEWTLLAPAVVLMLGAVQHGRNISAFLLFGVPAIAALLNFENQPLVRTIMPRREHHRLNALVLTGFILMMACGVTYAWTIPIGRLQWRPLSSGAIAAIAACPDRIYNRFDDGGYLLWFAPNRRVFIDNRQEPYPLELMQRHIRDESSGNYAEVFKRYDVRCAFLPVVSPTASRLRTDGWTIRYLDSQWVVLVNDQLSAHPLDR
jgi:hypothetical protein